MLKDLKKTKYVIGAAFILLGIGIVVATSLPKSMQYYVTVDELLKDESKYSGKELKVAGKVEAGSFQKGEDLNHKFRVINAGKIVSVSFHGALPDTFKEGADVVVTGKLYDGQQVVATDVLAKCASRYEDRLKPGLETPLRKGT